MSICSLIVSGLFPSALAEMKVNAASLPSLPSLPCTPDAPCSDLQGMLSGLLPDTQISTSSSREMVWNPGTARLVASRSGWFPGPAQPLAGEEWLQVLDMKIEHLFVSFFGTVVSTVILTFTMFICATSDGFKRLDVLTIIENDSQLAPSLPCAFCKVA